MNSQETLSKRERLVSILKTSLRPLKSADTWAERFLYLYLMLSVILMPLVLLLMLLVPILLLSLALTQNQPDYSAATTIARTSSGWLATEQPMASGRLKEGLRWDANVGLHMQSTPILSGAKPASPACEKQEDSQTQ